MAHPYAGHKQNAVGRRRVKLLMRTGGYHGDDLVQAAGKLKSRIAKHEEEERHGGEYASGGRIDKRARGGSIHKISPNKHKPHVNINILHHSRGAESPMTPPGLAAAPVAPTAGGGLPPPMPGMKRGGRAEYISGVSSGENLKKWKGYAGKGTVKYASGGRTESLQSLPNGGPANQLSPTPKSPGGGKPGDHGEARLRSDKRAWADKHGGTDKTRQPGKMRDNKHFGSGTGPGNLSTAISQKAGYP